MNAVRPVLRFTHRKLHTGPTLYCAEAGGGGEPLLYLHGYSDCWLSASPFLPHLPRTWRVLAPDQRGHGSSERPEGGYEIASLAADAAALLDDAGVARATVVGHSMGSLVAQRLALDHPARVSRLVLVGAGPRAAGPAVREVVEAVEGFGDEVPRDFVEAFQAGTAARPLPPAFLEAIVAESRRMPARVWRALVTEILAFDTRDELAKIGVPTRIVWGDADAFFGREHQDALLAGIPGSTLSVYEGSGHCPHWEEPERFARELTAFVEATTASGA
jgi:pimeloyl-ACP methyl ester carboxylesterase